VLVRKELGQDEGRLRHHRSVGHDGRPRRRDPRGHWTIQVLPNVQTCFLCRHYASPLCRAADRPLDRRKRSRDKEPIRWKRPIRRGCLREVGSTSRKGADMVMVKPGQAIARNRAAGKGTLRADLRLQVSGEIRDDPQPQATAGSTGKRAMMESLLGSSAPAPTH